MPSRSLLRSSVCIFAVLVSLQVLAQSNQAFLANQTKGLKVAQESSPGTPQRFSVAGHRARALKATAQLSNDSQASGLSFATAIAYKTGGNGANAIAIADVNGDGKPDLVVMNWCAYSSCTVPGNNIGVLLGKGDGTFQTAVVYASGGLYADSVVVADVNGDGKPDLVVANCGAGNNTHCVGASGNVGVLLGNGDGTFQPVVNYALGGYGSTSVAVADLRGDGKLDLVVAGDCAVGGCVGVLLGNGDGTFKPVVTYNSGGISALAVAAGDVNGDSKPDLVVANQCVDSTCTSSNVGVLLGNGDGTFQAVVNYGSGGLFSDSVAIADVNGDHKPDLIVANSFGSPAGLGNVGVLLGNGDGTFQTAVPYASGAFGAASVAVADVNGDGKPDLVVANCASGNNCVGTGNVGVLLGNGDGTFQTAVTYGGGGNAPFGVAVADMNGDGKPDIVAATCVSNVCGAGIGIAGVLINVSMTASATALSSSQNPSNFGQAVTFTTTVIAQPGFDKGTPTGTVSFFDGATQIGSSKLNSSGVATLMTSTLAVGTHSLTASYSGDTNFAPSTSAGLPQVVHGALVSLSPTSLNFGNQTVGIPSSPQVVTLQNTGNINLTITSIQITGANSGDFAQTNKCPASLSPNNSCQISVTFKPTSTGTRNAAVSVADNALGSPQSVSLGGVGVQASTTTTLTISPGTVAFGTGVTLTAKVNWAAGTPPDGEIVTFKNATGTLGTGALSKGTATFTSKTIAGGTYTVMASYSGDASFLPSASTQQALNVQDFKLSASPATVTVSASGQGGSTTITITPYGNLKAQSVSNWTCTGLPSGSNCSFGTVGSNDQVSLTITTTAASDLHWPVVGHHQRLFYAILLPGFLGMVSMAGQRRTLRRLRLLALLAVLGLPVLWMACGSGAKTGSNPGTPTGNSTVTISATSGTMQRSTTITVAVQ